MLKDHTVSLLNFIRAMLIGCGILCLCILLFVPFAVNEEYSGSIGENNQKTGEVAGDITVTQTFVQQYAQIRSIGILVDKRGNAELGGNLQLTLSDLSGTVYTTVSIPMSEVTEGGYYDIPVHCTLTPGTEYQYTVAAISSEEENTAGADSTSIDSMGTIDQATSQGISLGYRKLNTAGPNENGRLTYNGTEIGNGSLISCYYYDIPLSVMQKLTYGVFALLLLLMLYEAARRFLPEKIAAKQVRIDLVLRVALTIIGAAGTGALGYLCFYRRYFGGAVLDYVTYGLGIGFGLIYLLLAIWKTPLRYFSSKNCNCWTVLQNAIQILSIGFYLVMYVYYYNSGLNYGHYLGISYMNAAFGVFLLTLFTRKEVFSIPSAVYTVLYMAVCGGWMLTHEYDVDTRNLYFVAISVGLFWGIVIIRTVINLFHRKCRRISISYGILMAVFFAMLIIFRNGRQWPTFFAIFFILFYLQKIDEARLAVIFNNVCLAVLGVFWFLTYRALLHRPYHSFGYSRYPGVMTGVAVWGVFLLTLFAVAIVKFVIEYRKDSRFGHIWFYLLSVAAIVAYIIFSVSRTAMLGVLGIGVVLLVLLPFTIFRKQLVRLAKMTGVIVLSVVVLLPSFYTLTRTIPAVVNKPYIGIYEDLYWSIHSDDAPDSSKYMNVEAMLDICFSHIMLTFHGTGMTSSTYVDEEGNEVQISQEEFNQIGNLAANDPTSGRMDIWKAYLSQMNMTGHDTMLLEDTYETYAHAHNTYIQAAYDSGIPTGIIFLIVGAMSVIRAFCYFWKKKGVHLFTLLPLIVIMAFGIAGMTEWIFHPSNPMTFLLMFVQAPLLSPLWGSKAVQEADTK